jgi:hypothetical protein
MTGPGDTHMASWTRLHAPILAEPELPVGGMRVCAVRVTQMSALACHRRAPRTRAALVLTSDLRRLDRPGWQMLPANVQGMPGWL